MKRGRILLIAGLVAGLLDITYAFVVYGPLSYHMSPVDVLHSVAAGWLGKSASGSGGLATAALGLLTHFGIAISMAAAFTLVAMRFNAVRRNTAAWGLTYGLMLYLVMTYIVVPLSAAHSSQHFADSPQEMLARLQVSMSHARPADRLQLVGTLFTHMVFVGLSIALVCKRLMRPATK
jgi:uncharacterized membrane protein YagU involved in acid resistance